MRAMGLISDITATDVAVPLEMPIRHAAPQQVHRTEEEDVLRDRNLGVMPRRRLT